MTAAATPAITPPSTDATGDLALSPGLAQALLEELIHERVRTQVGLLELAWFERELDATIEHVLAQLDDGTAAADAPARVLSATLLDRAWQRVEDERRALRDGGVLGDLCPVCDRGGDDRDDRDGEAGIDHGRAAAHDLRGYDAGHATGQATDRARHARRTAGGRS
ncbi:MAG: hypothetical protein H6708_29455 [Kofleriaceae bacterium]|nr:hypothetical protein [Myxococcales bacterium]MCB9564532.1 hypothetical protein [Kofleriaceae bacterium]